MSTDAAGILFYGYWFHPDNEEGQPWEVQSLDESVSDWDWQVAYAAANGVHEPTINFDRENPQVLEEYHSFWKKRDALLDACPVTMEWEGGEGSLGRIVCVKASLLEAYWFDPRRVADGFQKYGLGWDRHIFEFCKALNIKFPDEMPSWMLAARYW